MTSQLLTITKSLPLRQLKTGGTLVIKSAPLPSNLTLAVHLVPRSTREDGHISLHQTLPRLQQNPTFTDISKEVDLNISTVSNADIKNPLIQILIDLKRNLVPRQQEEKNDGNVSWSHKYVPRLPYHYQEEETTDTIMDNSLSTVSTVKPRYRYITDDGRFLQSIPMDRAASSSSDIIPHPSNKTETVQQVEYTDGIIHLKDLNNYSSVGRKVKMDMEYEDIEENNHILTNMQLKTSETVIQLTATIPEKCNVRCLLQHLSSSQSSISMETGTKLEGEDGFEFVTKGGDIHISKLRGNKIHLSTDGKQDASNISTADSSESIIAFEKDLPQTLPMNVGGNIHVAQALEAQDLHVTLAKGARFRAKLIHSSQAKIISHDSHTCHNTLLDSDDGLALIDISSLYTTHLGHGAFLAVSPSNSNHVDYASTPRFNPRKVRVNSSHGHVSVKVTDDSPSDYILSPKRDWRDAYDRKLAVVELGSINGSFNVDLQHVSTPNHHHHNKNDSITHDLGLCARIHVDSLFHNQVSTLSCKYLGLSTDLTIDQKLELDMKLVSSPRLHQMDIQRLVSSGKDVYNYIQKQLDDIYSEPCKDHDTKAETINFKTNSFVEEFKLSCYDTVFLGGYLRSSSHLPVNSLLGYDIARGKVSRDGAMSQALNAFSSHETQGDSTFTPRPLIILATNGVIDVETLNWKQVISRRHGF